ncbi:hypothetical protein BL253_00760 [Pseudofrankia asymbiotica]|uniref:DUF6542 domain-containing protein n=1 Tax=Pseudofrankia asymbiotica TaxID=1834516 RepID=A0A1V2IL37_9ACTN|nr:hypothetical protein BL253_00760 [Pseudofrankia asymbiotica]
MPDRQPAGSRGRPDRPRGPVDRPPTGRRRSTLQPTTVISDNRRGLTAFGASLAVLIIGAVGAAADVAVFGHLGWIFGVLFVSACAASTLRTHVDDLVGVVIMPPLVYAVITAGVGFLHPATGSDGGLKTKAIDIGSELILRAPSLLIAELLVVSIALVRARRATVARRERARALAASRTRRDARP